MKKKLFKVMFIDEEKKVQTLHASNLNPSSFLGLVEVSDIVFIEQSELIITPDDGKLQEKFKNVEKSYIPLNSIVRIDEVMMEKETPIIRLYKEEDENPS
jgi:hypothetical protein